MKYVVTRVWEVDGDITPEEAYEAVKEVNSTHRRPESATVDVPVRRYTFEPSGWKAEHPDEEWDTGQKSTVAAVTEVKWQVATSGSLGIAVR